MTTPSSSDRGSPLTDVRGLECTGRGPFFDREPLKGSLTDSLSGVQVSLVASVDRADAQDACMHILKDLKRIAQIIQLHSGFAELDLQYKPRRRGESDPNVWAFG